MEIHYVITVLSWNNQDPEDHGQTELVAIFDNLAAAKSHVNKLSMPTSTPSIEDYVKELKANFDDIGNMSYNEWLSHLPQYDYSYSYSITEMKGINAEEGSTCIHIQYPLSSNL